jgi:aromatic-L-amino-acid decarboxylase
MRHHAGMAKSTDPQARASFHMTSADLVRHGRAAVDWIANYLDTLEQRPVLSRVKPGEIRSRLPINAPATGESFEQMLRDVDELIMPGITHWQSPHFHAYFPANTSGPAILGEMLSAGLGVNGMLWATSPACTELETHVLDWLVEMLDLPRKFLSSGAGGGVIQDTASSSTLCALLAARERATEYSSNRAGVDQSNKPLVAYASSQAHSSIEKAMMIAGLGRENLRLIDAPAACGFAMDVEALRGAIEDDIARGMRPCFVCATVGTTSSNAIDPVRAIADVSRRLWPGVWLHVDAAMSGTAALCPEFRWIHDGLEHADSYCFNPHKWMFTNFDCDCFYVADRAALINTLSVTPEYLRNPASASGGVFDYRDWHVPLGRRFRALKLWFVIRHYGIEGLQHHVREHVQCAQEFAAWIKADSRFEVVGAQPLNLVCFRLRSDDAINQQLLESLNTSGRLFLTHTKLDGQFVLRMCIGATRTERKHVVQAWDWIRNAADNV